MLLLSACRCIHKEQTATDLYDIETCSNDAYETLDRIEDCVQVDLTQTVFMHTHPCSEGDWRIAVLEDSDYSDTESDYSSDWHGMKKDNIRC